MMHTLYFILPFFLCLFCINFSKTFFVKLGFVDRPNYRSNHKDLKALGGGVIIIPIIVLSIYFLDSNFLKTSILIVGLLFLLSLFDDIFKINPIIKLVFHLVCIAFYTHSEINYNLNIFFPNFNDLSALSKILIYIFPIVFITGFMNAFNFMDGIDGITSIQTIVIFVSLMLFEKLLFNEINNVYLIIIACISAFLVFNWSPSKIFLGDSGSIPLGFLVIHYLIEFSYAGFWISAIILPLYYLIDTFLTLMIRIYKRKKFWRPHKEHFYQKAIKNGKSHRQVCFFIIVMLLGLFILSFFSLKYDSKIFFLITSFFWCAIFILNFLVKSHKSN